MTIGLGKGAIVTVLGGSGFVGRHSVRALARKGYRIRAAMRRPDLAGHLQPMGSPGQIQAVQANIRYPASVADAVAGADAVINLVAVLSPTGRQTFEKLHVEGARSAARAAREAGAKMFVHVSALGPDIQASSHYARTKAAGEAAVLAEFPGAIILRPSLIFGPEDGFFNRFASMMKISPVLPLIGGGRTKFQPVYVGDVAEAILACLDGRAQPGTIYELGGPDSLSFRKLLEKVQTFTNRRRPFVSLPFWLAKLQALMTWPLPNSLRPLTVDQVRLLQRDTVVSDIAREEGRTLSGLGIVDLKSIDVVVPSYLEWFRPGGQFASYRR